jgi:flagellar hook-basal body complex protein FliE
MGVFASPFPEKSFFDMLSAAAPRVNERSQQATEIAQKFWMHCGIGAGPSIYLGARPS